MLKDGGQLEEQMAGRGWIGAHKVADRVERVEQKVGST
jgi:hypothetical protein